jgi:hypothetical protein
VHRGWLDWLVVHAGPSVTFVCPLKNAAIELAKNGKKQQNDGAMV